MFSQFQLENVVSELLSQISVKGRRERFGKKEEEKKQQGKNKKNPT